MTTKAFDPKTAVYTPPEWAGYALEAIKRTQGSATRGLALPIAEIRDYFAPVLPGQVCALIAQTSNYKSGFMHFWEREAANALIEEGRIDEAIVHVSVEECVEEQAYLYLSRETGEDAGKLARGDIQDWKRLEEAATRIGNIPIYRIGDSLARAEDMPELYLSNMIRSIRELVTGWKIKPAALFFDYLQAFPFDPEVKRAAPSDQRRLQVREDIYRLRQAAAYFDCPVIVGVQAKQHLDGAPDAKNFQLPGIYDGEESSAIAQRADRIITMWMPKQTHAVGTTIKLPDKDMEFKVRENLLFVKVAKQRGGLPAGKTWPCAIDFNKNHIAPTDL
jgi:replicative DNA helicase